MDAGDNTKHELPVTPPRRVFPELITEHPEPGEEQVYGAAAEFVAEWREAWAARRAVRLTRSPYRYRAPRATRAAA